MKHILDGLKRRGATDVERAVVELAHELSVVAHGLGVARRPVVPETQSTQSDA